MRLGLGNRRRRGSVAVSGANAPEIKLPFFPPFTGWQTTAGRWRKDTRGWAQCPANAERPCYDESGAFLGYLFEGAETFYSAPWHDSAAPHGTADPAYLAKSLTSDVIAYAGAHSQADIHGTTGKGVEITQGATANGIITANNCVASVVVGDVVRIEMLVSIPATAGVAGTLAIRSAARSGTPAARALVLNYDASGDLTGWTAAVSNATFRADYAPAGIKSNGAKYWFVWMEHTATGAGSMAPAIGLPTAIPGRKIALHELRILKNPQTAPKAVPVLAAAKTFAADTMVAAAAALPTGALFYRLGRCRSRLGGGLISVSDARGGDGRCLMSGPYLPYENRLNLIPTAESADVPGILPNERQDIDFIPWLSPLDFRVPLGPGYYNQTVTATTGQNCTDFTVLPCFRSDPLLLPQVARYNTSPTFIAGKLTLDDTVVFARASTIAHQFEQVDLPGGYSGALQVFYTTTNISAQRCLFASHPVSQSRARGETQCDDDLNTSQVWIGSQAFFTKNGGTVDVSGASFWRIGRCLVPGAGTTATAITVKLDDCCFDQYWSDAVYTSIGTYTMSCNRVLFGRTTAAQSDLWQTRKEIEVNTGSGWQPLSASGIAVSALPLGRRASYAGTWNFTTATLAEAPQPDRTCVVRNFIRGSASATDKPGFQWNASQVRWPNETRLAGIGDVYVIMQDATPSPSRPWVRMTFDYGYWSGTSWVSGTGPAILVTGTHCDSFQINRTGCVINSISGDDCLVFGNAQGPFLTGNPTLAAVDSDIKSATFNRWIVLSAQSWALAFDYSKTPGSLVTVNDWLTLPLNSDFRYVNGTTNTLAVRADGANNTLALTNCWIGYKTGTTPVLLTAGATAIGTSNQIRIGEIANYATTLPASGPTIAQMLPGRWLDPQTYAVRDDIDPLDPAFAFTDYAQSATGMALNSILARARGTHARWARLKARLQRFHVQPRYVANVSASAPLDTPVLSGLRAKAWMPLWSGNEKGYFALSNGTLKVARSLSGINACWLLQTSDGATILVDIQ